ncbi:MAG: hypothetical protein MUO40_10160, partial [Anaerolineaceae bacterium]|nr:hypothetical protein [Anaerolineaceae bacterium]
VGLNETGLLNFTGLVNPDMILIRYAIGDRGKQARLSDCACGRSLPIMYEIEGRSSDLLITSDGRKIFWVNPVFYGLHVSQAQIIQEAIDQVRVKVIPAEKFGHRDIEKITDRLHERIGKEARVFIDIVETIAREKNGKLRPVISMINH